jgi:hypothetical protein
MQIKGKSRAMKLQITLFMLIAAVLLAFACGCDNGSGTSLRDQLETLSREKTTLKSQLERLQRENEGLIEQVEQLSSLGPEVRLEGLAELDSIEISRRSGLYDKDEDGRKEKLIVYVRPYDKTTDTVKAPGQVEVQLWDLNAQADGALLDQWEVGATELKELWAGTFMTNYYRLAFDVTDLLDGDEGELTIKIGFTDYITGKVLHAQKVIKP